MIWFQEILTWLPFGFTLVILFWLFSLTLGGGLSSRTVKISLTAILIVNILTIAGKIIYLFFQSKDEKYRSILESIYGQNYFLKISWDLVNPIFWSIVAGLGLVLLLLMIQKVSRSPLFDQTDLWLILLTMIAVGSTNVLVLILGSFVLMLFLQFFAVIKGKKAVLNFRLQIAPFLLAAAIIILILSNFSWYWQFLALIKLI